MLFEKKPMSGKDARPVFDWVLAQAKAQGKTFSPTWNFKGKFLVDSKGNMKLTSDPLADLKACFNDDGSVNQDFSFADAQSPSKK